VYRNILVPVDGSKLSERALVLAVPLADQHHAKLTLVTVNEPIEDLTLGGGAPVRDSALDEAWRGERSAYLKKLLKRVSRRAEASVEAVTLEGRVVPALAEYAAVQDVDLIVMCTHGRGGFQRLWLGSVAGGLSRVTAVPLLLARGGRAPGSRMLHEPLFRRILIPVDGSSRSESALHAAAALVGDAKSVITLGHVVHPMGLAVAVHLAPEREREVVAQYLEPLAATVRTEHLAVDTDTRVSTNVAKAILDMADDNEADLIAMTSQGMSGIERLVVGSVADKLIRTARVPVMICPAGAE
jgi:nucleotide-binding universal stress UspA family protein